MHTPDGFLNLWVAGLLWLGFGIVIGIAVRRARDELDDEQTLFPGVVTVGIFAVQMLNWPIPGGTSAHSVSEALAGTLLGPYLGVLAMSAAVTTRAFVFGGGGIIAPGMDLFAMAAVNVLVGYALFRTLQGVHGTGAAFVAGQGAIIVSALIVGVDIDLSSAFAYELSVTVLITIVGHAFLGFVRGAIMAAVCGYVMGAQPDLTFGRLDDDLLSPEVGL